MNFSEITNINIPEGVVSKIATLEGVVLWKKGDSDIVIPDLPEPLPNEIYYTTSYNDIEYINKYDELPKVISHTYTNGIGKLVFENDLTTIPNKTFYNCQGLTSIRLPNSITSIGETAFSVCTRLSFISIPEGVTVINQSAFLSSGLQYIELPNTLITIANDAFSNCSSLKRVVIPNGVTYIGADCFSDCSRLTSVIISDSVTSLGGSCFLRCDKLKSVVIGNGVEKINGYTFASCDSLQSITCLNSKAPSLSGMKYFSGLPEVGTLYIPNNASGYETWLKQLPNGWSIEYITE